MATLLSVTSSLLVGGILLVAPWWPLLWDSNYLVMPYPGLRAVLMSPYLRGTISGLGLVNILLAAMESFEYLSRRGERA